MKIEWKAKANGRIELWGEMGESVSIYSTDPQWRQLGFIQSNAPLVGVMLKEQGMAQRCLPVVADRLSRQITEKWVAVQAPRSAKMRKWFDTLEEAKAWLTCVVRLS